MTHLLAPRPTCLAPEAIQRVEVVVSPGGGVG